LEEKTSLREIRKNRKKAKENKELNTEFASDLVEIKPDEFQFDNQAVKAPDDGFEFIEE
jgi:hypothetical protein